MNYDHALLATKAFPFHKGHEFLIQTALEIADRVTVLVAGSHVDDPPTEVRAAWIADTYDERVHVIPIANIYLDDDDEESSKFWAVYAKQVIGNDKVDVIVSSEAYGPRWAEAMGVRHIMVDPPRSIVPVSGTLIRSDPYLYWNYINEHARQHYLKKVLIVGAESSGKTTLATNLSLKYGTTFSPEYGRIYDEQTRKGGQTPTKYDERVIFAEIVNRQPQFNAYAEANARHVCFYDTDLFTTALWYEQWQSEYGKDGLYYEIVNAAAKQKFDLVLIQDLAPFVDDGLRGHKHDRELFLSKITEFYSDHSNFAFLTGSWATREDKATDLVNQLFWTSNITLPITRVRYIT